MTVSLSGHAVLDNPAWGDSRLASAVIPGLKDVKLTLRREALPLFLHLAATMSKHIKTCERRDTWSYGYRKARAANAYSDHAAGMAIDLWSDSIGAQRWPTTMTRAQAAHVITILNNYRTSKGARIFGWGARRELGGDYGRMNDSMHFYVRPGVSLTDMKWSQARLGIGDDGWAVKAKPRAA